MRSLSSGTPPTFPSAPTRRSRRTRPRSHEMETGPYRMQLKPTTQTRFVSKVHSMKYYCLNVAMKVRALGHPIIDEFPTPPWDASTKLFASLEQVSALYHDFRKAQTDAPRYKVSLIPSIISYSRSTVIASMHRSRLRMTLLPRRTSTLRW